MSDDDISLMTGLDRRGRLSAEITYLMLKGAGWAAAVFFGLWIGIAFLAWLGTFLPAESKEAPDPTPLSYLSAPVAGTTAEV